MTGGLDMIIVDYLQKMRPDEKSETRSLAVGKISTGLKVIAKQLDIPVIALAQLNRDSAKRADKIPSQADLRDSGEIEQDADMILLLHRPSEFDDNEPQEKAMILIDKNRHGPCGTVMAEWNPSIMKWSGNSHYEY
jgi:replicative DNA helicase